ncbi:MAG TPA: DUF5667 domain-containing protein [Candidatus Paceibacterota bacterium]
MNKFDFQKGIEDIKKIGMNSSEKNLVQEKVEAYIQSTSPLKIKSPFFGSNFSSHFFFVRLTPVLSVFILFVLAGASSLSLSERSLPGDLLYPVKINFFEPLKYSLAKTAVLKAGVELQSLDNRLREAEVLISRGKFSSDLQVDLGRKLKSHSDSFKSVLSTALESEDSGVVEIEADFEAKINAHKKILDNFNLVSSQKDRQQDELKAQEIKQTLERDFSPPQTPTPNNKVMMMATFVAEVETQASTSLDTSETKLFDERRKAVEEIIRSTKENILKIKAQSKTNTFILSSAEKSIIDAENALRNADLENNLGNQENALSNLLDSRKMAQEADTSIKIGQEIEENK